MMLLKENHDNTHSKKRSTKDKNKPSVMVDFDMRELMMEKLINDSKLHVTMNSIEAGLKQKGL